VPVDYLARTSKADQIGIDLGVVAIPELAIVSE